MRSFYLLYILVVVGLSGCSTAEQRAQWDAECLANPDKDYAWCMPFNYDDDEWDAEEWLGG